MDRITPARRSANMAKIRSRDTAPEMAVRRFLHARGYRYRLHSRKLPGTPDLVFAGKRKILFVHGCFWHQHPGCARAFRPQSRQTFWDAKLAATIQRDRAAAAALKRAGWGVLVLWECQVRDLALLSRVVIPFLGPA